MENYSLSKLLNEKGIKIVDVYNSLPASIKPKYLNDWYRIVSGGRTMTVNKIKMLAEFLNKKYDIPIDEVILSVFKIKS